MFLTIYGVEKLQCERAATESVLISLDVFPNVYSVIYYVLKHSQKSLLSCQCTHSIPTILDLAEVCELTIKYEYALTLSDILSNPTSVKPSDLSIIHRVIESGLM